MFGARGEKKPSSKATPDAPPALAPAPAKSASVKPPKQRKAKAHGTKRGDKEDRDITRSKKDSIGNGIFKLTGMNLSRGNVKDDEEMSQVESTTTTNGNQSVNGSGVGQSFMGVGKDGMWISRKNFLRT